MKDKWKFISTSDKFRDRLFRIRHDRYYFSRTGIEKDYTVIDTNNWVNIIPVTSDNEVILIKQFRHGTKEIVIEIPGGVIENSDDTPHIAARRELQEETGYNSDIFIHLGTVIPNPAIQSNKCYIYLAKDVIKISDQNLDPCEEIEIFSVPKTAIPDMIKSGEINHSLVIDAFCLLMVHEERIFNERGVSN